MATRKIELLRGVQGLTLLVFPRFVLTRLYRVQADRDSIIVCRVLGGRHLAQAALSGIAPTPPILAVGVWVDLAHAITAVGFGAVDRPRARAGVMDALVAAAWAALGYHDLVAPAGSSSGSVDHDRRRDAIARLALRALPGGARLNRIASTPR